MSGLRKIFRLTLLIGHLFTGLIVVIIAFSPWWRHHLPANLPNRLLIWWNRALCRRLHLQLSYHGNLANPPCLLAVNHIAWLDIFVLLPLAPMTFVSKHEIAQWPVIGWLAQRAGTLFVQRGFNAMAVATEGMARVLTAGAYVAFFPEGTATDGTSVKRFHARMFQAAITADVMVQPVALRYPHGNGVSQIVPYIGDDTFLSNTWRLLGETEIAVEIWLCPPISATGKTRRELADYAQRQVTQIVCKSEISI